MANVKISDLAAFAAPFADDVFPIVDTSSDTTKKVTITTLMRSIPAGTESEPAIAFREDRNTGFYTPAGNNIGFVTGGVQRLVIDGSGNIGMGTTAPAFTYGGGLEIQRTGTATLRLQRTDATASALELTADSGATRLDTRTNTPMLFHTNGTERMRISSSGLMLLGVSSSLNVANLAGDLQVYDDISVISAAGFANAGTSCGYLTLGKSRSTTVGTPGTIVQSGDVLGEIRFAGDDGTDLVSQGARISAQVDGTPGSNDMPGRLVFSTTADGSSSPSERMRINSSGKMLLGTSTSRGVGSGTAATLQVEIAAGQTAASIVNNFAGGTGAILSLGHSRSTSIGSSAVLQAGDQLGQIRFAGADGTDLQSHGASITAAVDGTPGSNDMPGRLVFSTAADGASSPTERMRITSSGNIGFIGGSTSASSSANRAYINASTGVLYVGADGTAPTIFNRNTNDGNVVQIRQANTTEGTISVSGTTVSYNGAHLSRWSQLAGNAERIEILRGSVLSNLDEMCEWGEEDNEQLNRMKVSDVEGDVNVAGVFQGWDDDDDTYLNDFHCAMTGDFVIRIAQGTTVARGDLLMSAGDGTAKPQDDDIVRSKTVAKVTSTTVSATYADGSYCVPCVLMAC